MEELIVDSSFVKVVITASMSWIDLVSNIGGSLGLCAGISMLSLAEIIFWAIKYIGAKTGRENYPQMKRNKTARAQRHIVSY